MIRIVLFLLRQYCTGIKFHFQGFITDHERALEEILSQDAENSRRFDACLNEMATRIATVFASLKVSKLHILWFIQIRQPVSAKKRKCINLYLPLPFSSHF